MDVAGEFLSYYEYMIRVFMYARLLTVPVEGKVVHGFAGLDIGELLRVQLIDINFAQGYINFKKVSSPKHG